MRSKIVVVLAVAACVVGLQFALAGVLSSREGSDDKAVSQIEKLAPGYKQWFQNVWELPSDKVETLMFALQTLIGVGIITVYVIHNERRLRLKREEHQCK